MSEVFVLAVVASLDAGLLTAAVVLLGRPRPAQQLLAYLIGGMGLSIAFGLLIVSLPGAYYLAGLALLAKVGAPAATEVLAVVGFNVIMFALIELPLLGFVLAPKRTRSLTEKLNRWMTAHRRILIAIVAGAVGIYLLVSGVGDLG